jgi:NADPH2:quinone reductase
VDPGHGCPGVELVGTVEAVGPGVRFVPGDRVIATGPRVGGASSGGPGSYRSRAVVPAAALAVLSRGVSRLDAAALGLPAVAAWEALKKLGLRPGERVLVHAGNSAVGQAAIRLARLSGAEVAASGRRPERFGSLRAAGADETLDTSSPEWWRRVLPFDAIVDLLGGSAFEATLGLLAPGGRLVQVGSLDGEGLRLPEGLLRRGIHVTGWSIDSLTTADLQAAIDALARFVERGLLKVPPCTAFPLSEAAAAHAAMDAGQLVGRVVLRP